MAQDASAPPPAPNPTAADPISASDPAKVGEAPTPLHDPAPEREDTAPPLPPQLTDVGINEQLGESIPLDLAFTDEAGRSVTIGDYVDGDKPLVIALGYYRCPMMCDLVMHGLATAASTVAKDGDWAPGNHYRILMVSINPDERPDEAYAKKQSMLSRVRESAGDKAARDADSGWALLTGDQANIAPLAEAVGFGYAYVPDRDEYAHPAMIAIVSPQGTITRYLYGHRYVPRTLRLSLVEAAQGKVGNTLDRLLMFCFVYDESEKEYVPVAKNIMKLGGALTLLVVVAGLTGLFWMEHKRKHLTQDPAGPSPDGDPGSEHP